MKITWEQGFYSKYLFNENLEIIQCPLVSYIFTQVLKNQTKVFKVINDLKI